MTASLEHRTELLAAAARLDTAESGVAVIDLLDQYYRHILTEDLAQRPAEDLLGAALSHSGFAQIRQPHETLVRVFTPRIATHSWGTGATVVEVVTDDMPFVVDSITAELVRQDAQIRLLVHPQMGVERDNSGKVLSLRDSAAATAESWVHVEIDVGPDTADTQKLVQGIHRVLGDVGAAVADWHDMSSTALSIAETLATEPIPVPEEVEQAVSLLEWLAAGHFLFLGYREYQLSDRAGETDLVPVPNSGLGLLRETGAEHPRRLSGESAVRAHEPRLLVVTKANSRSTVHRSSYLDYISVKTFDARGQVRGERRFLGLFTSSAYSSSITGIPFLAAKADRILTVSGFAPHSHSAKDLLDVLETYPRDELFGADEEFLCDVATKIVSSREHRQTRLFLRKDDYGRFMSCLVYLPKDRYTTAVRVHIESLLMGALNGASADYTAGIGDSPLAMVHFVVRTEPGQSVPDVDGNELESRLMAAVRTWDDDWRAAVRTDYDEPTASRLIDRWGAGFNEAYKASYHPRIGVVDLRLLQGLTPGGMAINLHQRPGGAGAERRLKLYCDHTIPLTQVMPVLIDFGLEVTDERPHLVESSDGEVRHILDFGVRASSEDCWVRSGGVRSAFQDAFGAVWNGQAESDRFNQLVLAVGLTWEQIACLRMIAGYLKQTTHYSRQYLESALIENPQIAGLIVALFETRFDPRRFSGLVPDEERAQAEQSLATDIVERLEQVPSLDHDRIIRAFLSVIRAGVRTNFYQQRAVASGVHELTGSIAVKVDPRQIPHLPAPRPAYEIWVYHPRFEGVHLRFGKVARGGLRWSDRREDFRTEVLGLVKAQMVKNAVIVPTGAKGGFFAKRLPDPNQRDAWLAEGTRAYRGFIDALLSVTDNLVDREVVPPVDVIRHDGDDTYLVVAADKGTAAFSDLANSVSQAHGFWLDDAFASGGSTGYDHKVMGITARGAWESVKRHFRELGVDVQSQDFSVVGVGDMSGDVFGNGMLLSKHILLKAAFDHRHVFVDPTPDPQVSFEERQRLSVLPRSSWADYSATLISDGGGVFPRSAKSIPVSDQMREFLPLGAATHVTPAQLIRAILQADVDLLWNGGIGTYIKASSEQHSEIGDRANDTIRVDGNQLRCRVVGEGGNLGASQQGRIEAALCGVRINTDAIDNSGGVDSSDREVNIKILLAQLTGNGELTVKQRNRLLTSMTDEVAAHVLRTNYEQNVLLGNARCLEHQMLGAHERLMQWLEQQGLLDRELEALPDADTLAARARDGRGLTSPEFSVLMAYVKLALKEELITSDLPDDPWFESELRQYFPQPVQGYGEALASHPLRREIIVNAVANSIVNRGGITFTHRAMEETGATLPQLAAAFVIAREVFDLAGYVTQIEALDGTVDTTTQSELYVDFRRLLDRAVRALVGGRSSLGSIHDEVVRYREVADIVAGGLGALLVGEGQQRYMQQTERYVQRGVPVELARRAAGLLDSLAALDVADLSVHGGYLAQDVAEAYFRVSDLLHLDSVLSMATTLPHEARWDAMARASLREDVYRAVRDVVADVLHTTDVNRSVTERVDDWEHSHHDRLVAMRGIIDGLQDLPEVGLGPIWVLLRELQALVAPAS